MRPMIIDFSRDKDNKYISPVAEQCSAVIDPIYRIFIRKFGLTYGKEKFREWIIDTMPCRLSYKFNPGTGTDHIIEVEAIETDYFMFILKYAGQTEIRLGHEDNIL